MSRSIVPHRALFALAMLLCSSAAASETAAGALLSVQDADPLELARVVHRYGDAAILALLAPTQPGDARLAAVRASPWLQEPERSLLPLCGLITSRDSELAPAAARAAWQITRALDALALARRELSPEELSGALAALQAASSQASVRPDLRRIAGAAAAQLAAAGVPTPKPH
jgi:hypothetical protein